VRRGQPQGPANDQEIEEFIYDALELLPGTNDVEVRAEGGRVTLTGGVQQKRLKRDVGEIAWAIPSVSDVMNNVNIATRRRSRATGREAESQQPSAAGRKA
jgi:osmotically-inducible protein OsmY